MSYHMQHSRTEHAHCGVFNSTFSYIISVASQEVASGCDNKEFDECEEGSKTLKNSIFFSAFLVSDL